MHTKKDAARMKHSFPSQRAPSHIVICRQSVVDEERTLKQKEKLTGPEPRATISVAAVEQCSGKAVEFSVVIIKCWLASAVCVR